MGDGAGGRSEGRDMARFKGLPLKVRREDVMLQLGSTDFRSWSVILRNQIALSFTELSIFLEQCECYRTLFIPS